MSRSAGCSASKAISAQMLGVPNEWMYNAIKQVGNYGESFDRTVGKDSPLKLERGKNDLWTKGGAAVHPAVPMSLRGSR